MLCKGLLRHAARQRAVWYKSTSRGVTTIKRLEHVLVLLRHADRPQMFFLNSPLISTRTLQHVLSYVQTSAEDTLTGSSYVQTLASSSYQGMQLSCRQASSNPLDTCWAMYCLGSGPAISACSSCKQQVPVEQMNRQAGKVQLHGYRSASSIRKAGISVVKHNLPADHVCYSSHHQPCGMTKG